MKKCRIFCFCLILILTFLSFGGNSYADLNHGLVAYYPFNGNADDESGNGNHGVVTGATLMADRFGNHESAFLFTDGNITINNSDSLNPKSAVTITAWIYITEYPQDGYVGFTSIVNKW